MKDETPSVRGLPAHLEICRGCERHVYPKTKLCPHCGANVVKARRAYLSKIVKLQVAHARALTLLVKIKNRESKGQP